MNIHKVVLTVIDFDDIGSNGVIVELVNARYANRCISPNILSVDTVDFGEWSDDHKLNNRATERAEIDRLFGDANG